MTDTHATNPAATLSTGDRLAIGELLNRAAYALDERELDMLADCFSEDAQFTLRIAGGDLVGPFTGREQIMQLMTDSMAQQTDQRRHVVSNLFFTAGDANQAEAVSNLSLIATEQGRTALLSAGVYRDTLRREGDRWRLCRRHIDLDSPY
jgi:3-phenylpropionate/cinnamic acid dioxygenase small subunit